MTGATVVVVEDEAMIATALAHRLQREGYSVEVAQDGPSGVELCARLQPDLVVLDVMLPGLDGLEVCRRIQSERPVPVLMLTARDSETDMLIGLGVGADDYMAKPFRMREVVARVQVLLRRVERARTATETFVRAGDVDIDVSRRRVQRSGRAVHLTPIEFDLLLRFAARPGVVFRRDQLMADVWGYRDPSGARTVDSHIASLRRKLGAGLIRTVHGVGYSLEREGQEI
jgi:DNA-binding response OmpR family regulator